MPPWLFLGERILQLWPVVLAPAFVFWWVSLLETYTWPPTPLSFYLLARTYLLLSPLGCARAWAPGPDSTISSGHLELPYFNSSVEPWVRIILARPDKRSVTCWRTGWKGTCCLSKVVGTCPPMTRDPAWSVSAAAFRFVFCLMLPLFEPEALRYSVEPSFDPLVLKEEVA